MLSKKSMLVFVLLVVVAIAGMKIFRRVTMRSNIEKTLISDHWKSRYNEFLQEPRKYGGIVFLGNSLTEMFNLSTLGDSSIINRGINGDFTQGVLKRLPEVISLQPSRIFI